MSDERLKLRNPVGGKPAGFDLHALLLTSIVFLLPFGSAAELPILVAAASAIAMLLRGAIGWRAPSTQLAAVLFLAYWLPEVVSAVDSVAPAKSWLEVASDLRFGLLMLYAAAVLRSARRVRLAGIGLAATAAFWCADALIQAGTGVGIGGAGQVDRLSGIFGDGNLKLGGVIATLSPFLLLYAWRRHGWPAMLLALLPTVIVVLLAGARAAWVALAVVLVAVAWRQLGARRGSVALAGLLVVATVAAVGANALSSRFAERVDRTAQALRGDREAIDYALAGRLPIWRTALAMGAAHPLNGVGVRAFRHAYPDYAADDDKWVDTQRATGALHAHQWLLEVWSETGGFGLACWFAAIAIAWRAWRRAPAAARERAAAPAYALLAMLFPLNTHYAVYSSFWSILMMAMLALWIGALHAGEEAA